MSIPLYIFLFGYLLFFAIFLVFMIINMYHIVSTASFTFASFLVTFLVVAASIFTLYFTWVLLQGVDWQDTIEVFSNIRIGF